MKTRDYNKDVNDTATNDDDSGDAGWLQEYLNHNKHELQVYNKFLNNKQSTLMEEISKHKKHFEDA